MGCTQSVPAVETTVRKSEKKSLLLSEQAQQQQQKAGTSRCNSTTSDDDNIMYDHDDFTKDYKIIRPIGEGSVSKIYMVMKRNEINDGVVYILQIIDMKTVIPDKRNKMRNEIISLKDIQHPNILRVCDVYDSRKKKDTIAMVTDLCSGGEIHSTIPYKEHKARSIIRQILHAIFYMHQRGIYHHNLSTENVMFEDDRKLRIKVTYAGLAPNTYCNDDVADYLSESDHLDDIYSIGLITYQLLSGGLHPPTSVDSFCDPSTSHYPDDEEDDDDEYDIIDRELMSEFFRSECWKKIRISKEVKHFILLCIQPSIRKYSRKGPFNLNQALQHPWIKEELLPKRKNIYTTTKIPPLSSSMSSENNIKSVNKEELEASVPEQQSTVENEAFSIESSIPAVNEVREEHALLDDDKKNEIAIEITAALTAAQIIAQGETLEKNEEVDEVKESNAEDNIPENVSDTIADSNDRENNTVDVAVINEHLGVDNEVTEDIQPTEISKTEEYIPELGDSIDEHNAKDITTDHLDDDVVNDTSTTNDSEAKEELALNNVEETIHEDNSAKDDTTEHLDGNDVTNDADATEVCNNEDSIAVVVVGTVEMNQDEMNTEDVTIKDLDSDGIVNDSGLTKDIETTEFLSTGDFTPVLAGDGVDINHEENKGEDATTTEHLDIDVVVNDADVSKEIESTEIPISEEVSIPEPVAALNETNYEENNAKDVANERLGADDAVNDTVAALVETNYEENNAKDVTNEHLGADDAVNDTVAALVETNCEENNANDVTNEHLGADDAVNDTAVTDTIESIEASNTDDSIPKLTVDAVETMYEENNANDDTVEHLDENDNTVETIDVESTKVQAVRLDLEQIIPDDKNEPLNTSNIQNTSGEVQKDSTADAVLTDDAVALKTIVPDSETENVTIQEIPDESIDTADEKTSNNDNEENNNNDQFGTSEATQNVSDTKATVAVLSPSTGISTPKQRKPVTNYSLIRLRSPNNRMNLQTPERDVDESFSEHTSTPEEFHELRRVFHEVASSGTGGFCIESLKLKLSKKYTEEEVNSWFQGGNFDDSRNLKYKELLAEAMRSRRRIERNRVHEAFLTIDKGRRGFVTVGNLRAVLGTDNSEHIEQLIKEADTKKDGRITYDKFQEVLNQWNNSES